MQSIETLTGYDCAQGYSMSQDEQDATIGRIVRERKELKAKIEMLKAKAAKQGEFLIALGSAIQTKTELVVFNGLSSGANSLSNTVRFDVANYPQIQDIAAISNEIRETKNTLARVEEQATSLGI
jgi:prefoldin subunit 5